MLISDYFGSQIDYYRDICFDSEICSLLYRSFSIKLLMFDKMKIDFITCNVMKGIHCYLLEIQTEKDATRPITRLSRRRRNHMTSASRFDWFIIFRRPFPNFYQSFFFIFHFITHNP